MRKLLLAAIMAGSFSVPAQATYTVSVAGIARLGILGSPSADLLNDLGPAPYHFSAVAEFEDAPQGQGLEFRSYGIVKSFSLSGISLDKAPGGGAIIITTAQKFIFGAGGYDEYGRYFLYGLTLDSKELSDRVLDNGFLIVTDGRATFLYNDLQSIEINKSLLVFPKISNLYLPEPGTWAMMICGFALVGASMRRRAVAVIYC